MAEGPSPDDLIAGGIPLGDEDEAPEETFLGVPKGYVAQRPLPRPRGPGGPQPMGTPVPGGGAVPGAIAPRYRNGEQYRPQGFSPEVRAMIQAAMDRAGLYSKGTSYILGDWQEDDSLAYAKLLKYANRYGYTDQEALDQMRSLTEEERAANGLGRTGTGGAGGSGTRDPLIVSLSHPDDIRDLADRTARKTLGRRLNQSELTNFLSAYENMQRQTQAAEYGVQGAAGGGTFTQGPTPETFAETQIEAMDPLGAEAKKEVEVFKTISAHLGGIRGGG